MKRILLVVISIVLLFAAGCQSPSEPVITLVTPAPSPTPTSTPVPTATPDPTPTPTPEPAEASIIVVGDLLCLSAQLSAARSHGDYTFEECFAVVKDKITAADLAIGNLETLVAKDFPYSQPNADSSDASGAATGTDIPADPATGADPAAGTDPGAESDPAATPAPTKRPNPRINAPESFLSALSGCGFDVLTTSNNHVYDYKAEGLTQTLQKLDEYGFKHTGAYAQETDKVPLIMDVNGIKIAIFAYTDILNNRPGRDKAFMVDRYDEETVTSDIAAAREAGADFVLVSIHWGEEHTHKQNSSQKRMAAFIAEAGADIILGSHSHCVQPFETVETTRGHIPVIYSLGNFISSMSKTMHKDGVMVNLTLQKDMNNGETTMKTLTYIPTYCKSSSGAGKYVVYPCDLQSIQQSNMADILSKSRARTIDVLTENVAKAE